MAAQPARAAGPFAFVQRQLDSMTRRDRMLLTGLITMFGLLFVLLVLWLLNSSLRARAAEVRDKQDELDILAAQYEVVQDAQQSLRAAEARLEEYKGKKFPPYVENISEKTSVKELMTVKQLGTETVGDIRQTTFKVALKQAPLVEGYTFVAELENGGYPLRLRSTRFKRVFV